MTARRRLLVVVPAYQEQDCIARVVAEVRAAVPDAGVLVVDDASRDATRAQALGAGAQVLSLPINLGVGGAMRAGFRYALRNSFDIVVQVDGDGQHDPAEVNALVHGLDSADLVIGARFAGAGAYRATGPRRWAMKVLSLSLSRRAGTVLTDTTSGFRASGPRAVALFARNYPAEYLGDTVESLVLALRAGLVVRQVPVSMRLRQGGRPSNAHAKAAVYLLRAVFAMWLASIRKWDIPTPAAAPKVKEHRA